MRHSVLILLYACIGAFAQQPAASPDSGKTYTARCESCHGPKMTGNDKGPSILAWIRYHDDAEVTAMLAKNHGANSKMKLIALTDNERKSLLSDLRVLAGTNPTMATSGYTLTRGGGRGGSGAQFGRGGRDGGAPNAAAELTPLPALPTPSSPSRMGEQVSLKLSDGSTLAGKMLTDYRDAATLLTSDGKIHLLARNGDAYSEKSITPKADWTTYHGQVNGDRYSELEQVNTGNVSKLTPAWVSKMPNSNNLEASPVVVDGVMYVTGWNEIYAMDATNGEQLWTFNLPHTAGLRSNAGGGANRGAAVSGNRVFMVTDNAHIIALDRKSGAKLWDVETGKVEEGVSNSVAPLVIGDLVYVGMTGGEEGARGFLDAYRVATGERAWRFWTIPAHGEKGSETWIGAALEHGCGTTWLTGSYDASLDSLYWAIGNPCPDINGDERKGDNLYTNSVVALNPKTGKMKWYYQFTPHDTHDWDSVESLIPVDETWEGKPRKLLLHGDRNGMFYVLDRTDGKFLQASQLSSKVTWNTGYTKDGKPILTSTFEATPEGVAICPAGNGGANWQDASYSPVAKLFYVRVSDSCGTYQTSPDPLNGQNRWYGQGNTPSPEAQKALADLRADYQQGTFIRAMDPFTGKKVWDYPFNGRSGVLSTAGGLVFIGTTGGLTALDYKTGAKVWSVDVGSTSAGSPITYMVGGKQYVAITGTGAVIAYTVQ